MKVTKSKEDTLELRFPGTHLQGVLKGKCHFQCYRRVAILTEQATVWVWVAGVALDKVTLYLR